MMNPIPNQDGGFQQLPLAQLLALLQAARSSGQQLFNGGQPPTLPQGGQLRPLLAAAAGQPHDIVQPMPPPPPGRPPFDTAGDTRTPDGTLNLGQPLPPAANHSPMIDAVTQVEQNRSRQHVRPHPHSGLYGQHGNPPMGPGELGGFYTPQNAPAWLRNLLLRHRQGGMGAV